MLITDKEILEIDTDNVKNDIIIRDVRTDDFNFSLDKNKKLPKLPKEFFEENEKEEIVGNNKNTVNNKKNEVTKIEEEDTLDCYMKTIEKDATMQEYEIIQKFYNQQLQQRYDEVAEKDGYEMDEGKE